MKTQILIVWNSLEISGIHWELLWDVLGFSGIIWDFKDSLGFSRFSDILKCFERFSEENLWCCLDVSVFARQHRLVWNGGRG